VVETLPFASSVRVAGVLGPVGLLAGPKTETISPGETAPAAALAAFRTIEMVGGGCPTMI
jgi:hypothetical protein